MINVRVFWWNKRSLPTERKAIYYKFTFFFNWSSVIKLCLVDRLLYHQRFITLFWSWKEPDIISNKILLYLHNFEEGFPIFIIDKSVIEHSVHFVYPQSSYFVSSFTSLGTSVTPEQQYTLRKLKNKLIKNYQIFILS